MNKKKKVVLSYYALIHYRKTLFDYLLESEDFELHILCGKKSHMDDMKYYNSDSKQIHFVKNYFFNVGAERGIIQRSIIRSVLKLNPDVLILRGVNPLMVSSLYLFLFFKIFKRKTKILWWGHGTLGNQGKPGEYFRKFFYKHANGVLLQGEKGVSILTKIGIAKNKLFVIGNNLDDNELGFNKKIIQPNIVNDQIKIIFTGRLIKLRKLEVLIEALSLLKKQSIPFSCSIIGDGPCYTEMQAMVNDMKLEEEVVMPGAKYGDELVPFFEEANLMIIPNYAGLSLIHGLSYGIPFITSDNLEVHGPEIEVLNPGITGTTYEAHNPAALVKEISDWKQKLSLKNNIHTMCVNSIKDSFTYQAVGGKIRNVIQEIC